MLRTSMVAMLCFVFFLGSTVAVFAENPATSQVKEQSASLEKGKKATPEAMAAGQPVSEGRFRVTNVLEKKVENPQGESIGTITDLIAGDDGQLRFAILDHGGFLGIGAKLVPIPWRAVRRGPDKDTLIINVTKETLEKAPNFDKKSWPNMSESQWELGVQRHYDLDKDMSRPQSPALQPKTDMSGK